MPPIDPQERDCDFTYDLSRQAWWCEEHHVYVEADDAKGPAMCDIAREKKER